jgi:putative FmdB family regulatory protein
MAGSQFFADIDGALAVRIVSMADCPDRSTSDMPVYEYECKACGRDFEYQQRMSDPDKTTCEVCGGSLERLISRTAFSLKGSGWYKDLYASPKPEKADGKTDGKTDAGAAKADAPAASADKAAASADKPASSSNSGTGSSSGGSSSGGSSSGSSGGGSSSSASSSSSAAAAKSR